MPGLLFFCPFGVMGVFYYAESFIRQVRVPPKINFRSLERRKEEFETKKRSFVAIDQIRANLIDNNNNKKH